MLKWLDHDGEPRHGGGREVRHGGAIADRCPDAPEDGDSFRDDDGCPEADNDGDALRDQDDRSLNDAETYNGAPDEDGGPDVEAKAFNAPRGG